MSSESYVLWPNIGLVHGRLFGLGRSVPLPTDSHAPASASASQNLTAGHARLLLPCVAMAAGDREWLAVQASLGHRPATVASALVLLPALPAGL
jgi:hypothetical protein